MAGTITYAGNAERFLVSDCAGDQRTRDWMAWNNIPVELDYATAARWNAVGRGARVIVCKPVLNAGDQQQ